jgi:hypothetical protein
MAKDTWDVKGDKWDVTGWCGSAIEGIVSRECRWELGEWVTKWMASSGTNTQQWRETWCQ